MTREEALNKYPHGWMEDNRYNDYPKDEIINLIYDDFENQKCENCKYWANTENDVHGISGVNEEFCLKVNSGTTKDFGCNRWQANAK